MSTGMILFIAGIVGLIGTLAWIIFDKSKAKSTEDRLVYLALEKSYGSDTEKLKEVHTALKLSKTTLTSGTIDKSKMETTSMNRMDELSERETTILTEPMEHTEAETEIIARPTSSTQKIDF